MAKGVINRSGSGSCTQPEHNGDNSSRDQEPGRPGSPAPKALESGRIIQSKKTRPRPRDSPGSFHKWKPPFQPGETNPHRESKDPQAQTWGAEIDKRNVFQSQCFPKSEGCHNGEWPQKRGKASKPEGHSRTPALDAEATAATLLYDRSQGRGP